MLVFIIRETKDDRALPFVIEELNGHMANLLNDPFDLRNFKDDPTRSFEEIVGRPPYPVTPLSIAEFYLLYDRYEDVRYDDEIWDRPPTFAKRASAAVEEQKQFLEEGKRSVDDLTMLFTHRRPRQFARLSVDLYNPDREIKKSFASWLANHRRQTYVKQPLCTAAKLRQWHRNSVLPYNDISLWRGFSKNMLGNEAIASLILPQYKIDTDNPLKDTEKDYAVVIKDIMVDRLLKLAKTS